LDGAISCVIFNSVILPTPVAGPGKIMARSAAYLFCRHQILDSHEQPLSAREELDLFEEITGQTIAYRNREPKPDDFPELAIADGALGFWKAAGEVWPTTREQRCWVYKTANVLAKLPKSQQPKAKRALQEIWMAETKADAEAAFDAFIESYRTKYDKAAECLTKDRDAFADLL
jgi:hypothetical protein